MPPSSTACPLVRAVSASTAGRRRKGRRKPWVRRIRGLSAQWDLSFTPRASSLEHLRSQILYRAPLPRTKATSPVPDLGVGGTLVVDDMPVDLSGWTGMLGHNWGTEHAARWIWLRACGLGDDGSGWLDAVLGRVRIGPVLAPWTAFGALELDGTRHNLGGLLTRGTSVAVSESAAAIGLVGPGCPSASAPRSRPEKLSAGSMRTLVAIATRSSTAPSPISPSWSTGELEDDCPPEPARVLEIGGDRRAFDVPLQPFPD